VFDHAFQFSQALLEPPADRDNAHLEHPSQNLVAQDSAFVLSTPSTAQIDSSVQRLWPYDGELAGSLGITPTFVPRSAPGWSITFPFKTPSGAPQPHLTATAADVDKAPRAPSLVSATPTAAKPQWKCDQQKIESRRLREVMELNATFIGRVSI
jgi:hypothetical protein